ncbi:aldo/keto reductase [Actinomyces wuliandei]|uniref:aldo/keto reductase n=1 Tax=Actinomyces wuliandei TaxID=2057743 RepID=UPI000FDA2116|nr:aldo/keto reductase [Actinomyces wuliandei]
MRHLGELEVSDIGLGCLGMSWAYGYADPALARQTITLAVEEGVTLFDTAASYGHGNNERLLGQALGRRRSEVVVATKTGLTSLPVFGIPTGRDGRPRTIRRAVDDSLRRLGTDWIDLYYLHRVDPKVPVEESIGAMAEAVQAGKVRYLGVSEATADEVRRAHATHPLSALQMEWSLFRRKVEDQVLGVARELGIGVVAYSPLGQGMLTGHPSSTTRLGRLDYRRFMPRWRGDGLRTNMRQVAVVQEVADQVGASAAQVALAWLLAKGEDVVPIPGTTKPHNLRSNLGATTVRLSPQQVERLDAVAAASRF